MADLAGVANLEAAYFPAKWQGLSSSPGGVHVSSGMPDTSHHSAVTLRNK
jgi:hypothetical protein